jgi:AraC-like DNA-binding protein
VPVAGLHAEAAFRARSRPASAVLQRLGATLLHEAAHRETLAADEHLLTFVRTALQCPGRPYAVSPSTLRLVARAKAYLTERVSTRVRLRDVAQAAGTTPAYLTTLFRQLEGQPLHKYLVQLRLSRALAELPYTADITTLAADLGFAHHSHFTAVFRRAFGCTPSGYRTSTRALHTRTLATLHSGPRGWRRLPKAV